MKDQVRRLFDDDGELIVLGTVEGDTPFVRYMIGHADDDLNVYFATYRGTRKVSQLEANPKVCFVVGGDPTDWRKPYARFFGTCERVDDLEMKKKLWRPLYANFFSGPEDENFTLFVIRPEKVEFMLPAENRVEIIEF
ncbi:MAG: hypothetical protein D6713_07165 [Deltaproteobacteria bacterium]|nr:MAG: hypothetical protein D6713_07165 [Deltaproteobacteria bacterium]